MGLNTPPVVRPQCAATCDLRGAAAAPSPVIGLAQHGGSRSPRSRERSRSRCALRVFAFAVAVAVAVASRRRCAFPRSSADARHAVSHLLRPRVLTSGDGAVSHQHHQHSPLPLAPPGIIKYLFIAVIIMRNAMRAGRAPSHLCGPHLPPRS